MAADTSGRRRNGRRRRARASRRPVRQLTRLTDLRVQLLVSIVAAAAAITVASINNSGPREAAPPPPGSAPTSSAPARPTRAIDATRGPASRIPRSVSASPSVPAVTTVSAPPAMSPILTPLAVPPEHVLESGGRSLKVHVGRGPQPNLQLEGEGWPIRLALTCYLDESKAGDFTTSGGGTFAGPLHFQYRYPQGIPDGEYDAACSNEDGSVHARTSFTVPAP